MKACRERNVNKGNGGVARRLLLKHIHQLTFAGRATQLPTRSASGIILLPNHQTHSPLSRSSVISVTSSACLKEKVSGSCVTLSGLEMLREFLSLLQSK